MSKTRENRSPRLGKRPRQRLAVHSALMRDRFPTGFTRVLTLGIVLSGLACVTGCESTGLSYDALYEGFFGDEPPPLRSKL